MNQTTTDTHAYKHGKGFYISITDTTLLGYGIFEHTYARIVGYFSSAVLGKAIYGQWLCLVIWLCLLALFIMKRIHDRRTTRIVFSMIFSAVFFVIMYLLFPSTQQYYSEYMTDIITVIIIGIPCAVLLSTVDDLNLLILSFRPFLRVGTVLCVLGLLFGARARFLSSMGWGMAIMPVALFYYGHNRILKREPELYLTRIDRVFGILAIMMTLLGGRQWLVIVFAAIFFCNIFQADTRRQKIYRTIIGVILLAIVALFYDSLLEILSSLISRMGIQSRALSSLASGRLLDTYNRNSIYSFCQDIIQRNGSKISGVFADRMYLRQYRSNIAYAHNFFYEILIDFGTVLGVVLIASFALLLIRGYVTCRKDMKVIFVLVFCYGFLRFLVSSCVFIEINFVILLGLLLNRNIRISERNNSDRTSEV